MPIRPCPDCGAPTPRKLDGMSADVQVWYYRCEKCGCVWNVPKAQPDGPQRPVTEPRPRDQEA